MYTALVLDSLIRGDFEKYGPRGTNEHAFTSLGDPPPEFLTGALAESWEVTPDRIVFHLRQGVDWYAVGKEHVMESREFIADDIIWSLLGEGSIEGVHGPMMTEHGGFVDNFYAEDKYTLVVETSRFDANWPLQFGLNSVIYPHEMGAAGAADWNNLVGTGPFVFKEIVQGSQVTFERNPTFWGTATINGVEYPIPFVDELIYPAIADESVRVAALRTAKIDVYFNMKVKYEETLAQTNPELMKKLVFPPDTAFIALTVHREPFSIKEVRQAMQVALDLEAINKALFLKGEFYPGPLMPDLKAHTPLDELPAETRLLFDYNPGLARQMLADAGYPEGFKVTAITGDPETLSLTMASSYWEAIGVELEIKVFEGAVIESMMGSLIEEGVGDFDVVEYGYTNHSPPFSLMPWYQTSPVPNWENASLYNNPYFNELFMEALETVDPAERDDMFKELNLIAIDDMAYICLGGGYWLNYWWPWAKNFYGERSTSLHSGKYVTAAIWLDPDLKAEMGY
nr:hypothetical protein [Bacillota bacterium]